MRRLSALATTGLLVATVLVAAPQMASSAPTKTHVAWQQVDDNSLPGCLSDCPTSPPSGPGGAMAFDAATHQLLLFSPDGENSTWVWDGRTWTQVDDTTDPGCTSCTDSPPARNTFGMAYDPVSQTVIVFGGYEYNDTWAWNGTSWSQIVDGNDPGCTTTCTASPPSSIGTQMTYDAATNQMILFGGSVAYSGPNVNATWMLTYRGGTTYTWAQVDDQGDPGCVTDCTASPPGRNVADLAYDVASRQLVVFGGEQTASEANGLNDTWLWTGNSWSQVSDGGGVNAGCGESSPTPDLCPSSPPPRVGSSMAYDPAIGGLVLFGGMTDYGRPQYNDTWEWNGTAWMQVDDFNAAACESTCPGSPPVDDTFSLAEDPVTKQLVLEGGSPDYNFTWAAEAMPALPSAPQNVRGTTVGLSIRANWSPPSFLGAGPITRYLAIVTPGHHWCLTTGALHCTILGLSPKHHYTIWVRDLNSVGLSPPATVSGVKG